MRQFYLSDPELFNIKISSFDFMVYEYFCRNYDLKRLRAYIRMIDAADRFKVPMEKIKDSLDRLSRTSINYKPLITHNDFRYYEMPRYREFLEGIQFRKHHSSRGWTNLKKKVQKDLNGAYE